MIRQTPDVIGKIVDTEGTFDEDGNELTPTTFIEGWHVNFQSEVPELAEYKLDPQPSKFKRIYAGGIKPVAYKFPDQETFESLLNPPEEVNDEGEV